MGVFRPLPEDEGLQQMGWVAAVATADGERIVGILDSQVESPGWTISVVHTANTGATWVIGPILKKPYYMATLASFDLDDHGAGRIVLSLDDDYGTSLPTGRYVATTTDGGHHFSDFALAAP